MHPCIYPHRRQATVPSRGSSRRRGRVRLRLQAQPAALFDLRRQALPERRRGLDVRPLLDEELDGLLVALCARPMQCRLLEALALVVYYRRLRLVLRAQQGGREEASALPPTPQRCPGSSSAEK